MNSAFMLAFMLIYAFVGIVFSTWLYYRKLDCDALPLAVMFGILWPLAGFVLLGVYAGKRIAGRGE